MTSPAENFLVLLLKPVIFVFNELLKVQFFFFNSNSLFYKDEFIHPFSAIKIPLWAKVGWGCTSGYLSQGMLTLELADPPPPR